MLHFIWQVVRESYHTDECHFVYFSPDLLIESVKTTDLSVSHEALVYSLGSIKLLSGNSTIVKLFVKKDLIVILGHLLMLINKSVGNNLYFVWEILIFLML